MSASLSACFDESFVLSSKSPDAFVVLEAFFAVSLSAFCCLPVKDTSADKVSVVVVTEEPFVLYFLANLRLCLSIDFIFANSSGESRIES